MGDATSETDMEFDWADETLHAEYGRRWLRRAAGGARAGPGVVAVGAGALRATRPRAGSPGRAPNDLERIRGCADALVAAGRSWRNGCQARLRRAGSSWTRWVSGPASRS